MYVFHNKRILTFNARSKSARSQSGGRSVRPAPGSMHDHVFVDRLVVVALYFSRLRHIHSIWQPQILIVVGSCFNGKSSS